MTGAEHYEEAERLLALCAGAKRGSQEDRDATAAAQVHATLALAASQRMDHVWGSEWASDAPDSWRRERSAIIAAARRFAVSQPLAQALALHEFVALLGSGFPLDDEGRLVGAP